VVTPFEASAMARAVAVAPDGTIIVAGSVQPSAAFTTTDFLVARYNADGSLDTAFGSGDEPAFFFCARRLERPWRCPMQEIGRYAMLGDNDRQVVVIEWADRGGRSYQGEVLTPRRLITKDGRTVKYVDNGVYLALGQVVESLRPGLDGRQPERPEDFAK
jgi:Domain of unknown function (DUF5122) beta-propeller